MNGDAVFFTTQACILQWQEKYFVAVHRIHVNARTIVYTQWLVHMYSLIPETTSTTPKTTWATTRCTSTKETIQLPIMCTTRYITTEASSTQLGTTIAPFYNTQNVSPMTTTKFDPCTYIAFYCILKTVGVGRGGVCGEVPPPPPPPTSFFCFCVSENRHNIYIHVYSIHKHLEILFHQVHLAQTVNSEHRLMWVHYVKDIRGAKFQRSNCNSLKIKINCETWYLAINLINREIQSIQKLS